MLPGIGALIGAKFRSSTYTPTDSDAAAFLSAAGITDSTISQAIDNLVIAAKANSWWTFMFSYISYGWWNSKYL
jgi:hypothetical protein